MTKLLGRKILVTGGGAIKTHRPILNILHILLLLSLFLLPFYGMIFVRFVDGYDFLLHFHMIHTLENYIRQGVFLPRWLPTAVYGYGSPILTFMWAAPYYLGVFLHMAGISYDVVFKALLVLPTLLSGLGMYVWLRRKYGRFISTIASVVYVWTPYRFVDTFKRGAIGELFFFGLFPFIMYFLDNAIKRKHVFLGSVTCALLIYSHQGMSLVGYTIFFFYMLLQYVNHQNTRLLRQQVHILAGGLLLCAFFWIPAIAYHSLLPFGHSIAKEWFPPLFSLIRSKWEGGIFEGQWLIFSFQIGITQLFILFLSHITFIYCIMNKKINELSRLFFWLLIFWISIFFLHPASEWTWMHIPFIAYLQFPFRFLFIPMLCASILVSELLSKVNRKIRYLLGIFIIILALYSNRNHLGVLEKSVDLKEFVNYNGTYDVGGEKLPKYVNLSLIEQEVKEGKAANEFSIVEGNGQIDTESRLNYSSSASLTMKSDGKVAIRRIYFPGWNVLVNGHRLNEDEFTKTNGIILPLMKGSYTVDVFYKDPNLTIIANVISIFTMFFFFYRYILRRHTFTKKSR